MIKEEFRMHHKVAREIIIESNTKVKPESYKLEDNYRKEIAFCLIVALYQLIELIVEELC